MPLFLQRCLVWLWFLWCGGGIIQEVYRAIRQQQPVYAMSLVLLSWGLMMAGTAAILRIKG